MSHHLMGAVTLWSLSATPHISQALSPSPCDVPPPLYPHVPLSLCSCPHGPVYPSLCPLPCVPVSPIPPRPVPCVPALVSLSLCPRVPVSPCPHLHGPIPVSLSSRPHVLMPLCLQVPASPCPLVPVSVSPHPRAGLPVLRGELPRRGAGAGTREKDMRTSSRVAAAPVPIPSVGPGACA